MGGHALVDRATLVEYRDHGELLHMEPALFADQFLAAGVQPRRLPALQLVQTIPQVERHEIIQTRGCDTYPPDKDSEWEFL